MDAFGDIQIRAGGGTFGVGTGKVIKMANIKADMNNLAPLEFDASTQHEIIKWKQEA